jgi:4-hydroxybenzoate polyprenyltransferase
VSRREDTVRKGGSSTRAAAYLQLVRFPNLFTAVADVLAGGIIVLGMSLKQGPFALLLLSSALIYAGGCALNDFCDRKVDAQERPSRPIPSGRVSPAEGLILACALLITGLAAALPAGGISFSIALCLVLSVVSYDIASKKMELAGPMNMALCRALNLMLGMSVGEAFLEDGLTFILPLLSFAYVFALTLLSRWEVEGTPAARRGIIAGTWGAVVAGIVLLWLGGVFLGWSLLFLVVFASFTGPGMLKALQHPEPPLVGQAVKFMVLGIVLLDAVYVAGVRGMPIAVPVALMILPPILLSRRYYIT